MTEDIQLDRYEEQVIKCLNEHLKDYLDNDFSQRLINRVYDEFILDHFRIMQTIERVKKQHLKLEVENDKETESLL